MGFRCGIVGLPNVGKSTLFNALTTSNIEACNYPFCTIEPNIGVVEVPDPRLDRLAEMVKTRSKVQTRLEFVDIAGLVKGASLGEGLGNQFLGHIRQVDAIAHVVRCFEDDNIVHVDGVVDPLRDVEVINTELLLADIDSVERRLERIAAKMRSGDKEMLCQHQVCLKLVQLFNDGVPARLYEPATDAERRIIRELCLLTAKPVLYVANVSEADAASGNAYVRTLESRVADQNSSVVVVCAAIEEELSALTAEERLAFLHEMGVEETGLPRLTRTGHNLLGLITFFTVGEKETKAWTVRKGTLAPQAAGSIHSDFERGFIRAEVIAFEDFVNCNGEAGARESGLMRLEGKEYIVKDGDCVHFRFNV